MTWDCSSSEIKEIRDKNWDFHHDIILGLGSYNQKTFFISDGILQYQKLA